MAKILIVGAGVIGLTTAYQLLKSGEHQVSLIAKDLPGDLTRDYTSPKAGAFYYPPSKYGSPEYLKDFDLEAYSRIIEISQKYPESGVYVTKAKCYIDASIPEEVAEFKANGGPWWKNDVLNYKIIPEDDFPLPNIEFGFEYDSFVVTPVHYLFFLLFESIKMGLNYRRHSIEKLSEACDLFIDATTKEFTRADVIINCTGNGAIKLVTSDKTTFPIRGQTLLVENTAECLKIVELEEPGFEDETVYIIPRKEGGTLINGIYAFRDNSTHIDPNLSKRIIDRAIKYAPELIDTTYKNNKNFLNIVSENYGLRPGRLDGPRVEADDEFSKENGVKLIHNYGCGASGYIQSFATADQVVRLIDRSSCKCKL